jgi:hypothetical protein
VFLVNSRLGLVTATSIGFRGKPLHLPEALLIPKLRSQCAEFLNERSLIRLGILSLPTCVGLRYGQLTNFLEVFLGGMGSVSSIALRRTSSRASEMRPPDLPGGPPVLVSVHVHQYGSLTLPRHPIGMTRISWRRNVDLLSIGYALRPGLRIRLTLRGLPFLRKPWVFGVRGSRPHCRYLCQQNLFRAVQPSLRSTFNPHGMLLYHSPA